MYTRDTGRRYHHFLCVVYHCSALVLIFVLFVVLVLNF